MPHVDLTTWGLDGCKTYKKNKFRNWIATAVGYTSQENPGPENFQVRLIGWRVFATARLMPRIASTAALEVYENRTEKLNRLWSDTWHLVATADDQRRTE
jgi:hypothetical protein